MKCPECNTWNPDDKTRCWRCNALLPTPPEPKKRRQVSSQTWVWVVAILMFVLTALIQCGFFGGRGGGEGTGYLWGPLSTLVRALV